MPDDVEITRTAHGGKRIRVVASEPSRAVLAQPASAVDDEPRHEPDPVTIEPEGRAEEPSEEPDDVPVVETAESVRERLQRFRRERAAEKARPEHAEVSVDVVAQAERAADEPSETAPPPGPGRQEAGAAQTPARRGEGARGLLARLRRGDGEEATTPERRAGFTVLSYGSGADLVRPGTSPLVHRSPAAGAAEAEPEAAPEPTQEPELEQEAAPELEVPPPPERATDEDVVALDEPEPSQEAEPVEEAPADKPSRRFFGLLGPKEPKVMSEEQVDEGSTQAEAAEPSEDADAGDRSKPARRGLLARLGLGRRAKGPADVAVRPEDLVPAPVPTPPLAREAEADVLGDADQVVLDEVVIETEGPDEAPEVRTETLEAAIAAAEAEVQDETPDEPRPKGRLRGLLSRRSSGDGATEAGDADEAAAPEEQPRPKKAKKARKAKKRKEAKKANQRKEAKEAKRAAKRRKAEEAPAPEARPPALDPLADAAAEAPAPTPPTPQEPAPALAEPVAEIEAEAPEAAPELVRAKAPAAAEPPVAAPVEAPGPGPDPEPDQGREPDEVPAPVARRRARDLDDLLAKVERTLEEHREEPPELLLPRR